MTGVANDIGTGATASARAIAGRTLCELAAEDPRVWGMTPDTGAPIADFARTFPDRYIDVGIAEQNAVGVAAGLALEGMIPFIAGMAPFLSMRSFEQVRTDVCYQNLPVRFVAWNGGLTTGGGSTHNAMEDIALMKVIVNMNVVSLADPGMVAPVMRQSMSLPGPLFIRLGNGKSDPCLYDLDTVDVRIGKGHVARDGDDVTIFAHGEPVTEMLYAAELLAAEGISARVVDMYSISPLDTELLFRCVEETGHVVVVEDHLIHGGLASSIADRFVDAGVLPKAFRRLGVPQVYTGFGSAHDQWVKYGYDRVGVVAAVKRMLG
ncbi:transketolase C-terminal domain-containing protein [Streptomyces sp. NPDC051985]|uniref:transketolase family protein n=1 Tax=Streptomyces sp. NPDC051985 TaxID=3155807 RepID=UPI0034387166